MVDTDATVTTYFVTGGAGFIGSNYVLDLVKRKRTKVVVFDKLDDSSGLSSLRACIDAGRIEVIKADLLDREAVFDAVSDCCPNKIVHFAAESHVDTSLEYPSAVMLNNVMGTVNLLDASLNIISKLGTGFVEDFRFHLISTDEIFGDLPLITSAETKRSEQNDKFSEESQIRPSSPYSASKASAFFCVKAWERSFNLPVSISHCSNNYGPNQHKEKLIPKVIFNALHGNEITIYGDGKNVRDWLFVDDHISSINLIIEKGSAGSVYNVGGGCEVSNIDLVNQICTILDKNLPAKNNRHTQNIRSYTDLIRFVTDRKGHDLRYAVDFSKINKELNWRPTTTLADGLSKTVGHELNKFFSENP